MIDSALLLRDLKRLTRRLEGDLREVHSISDSGQALQTEWQAAREAGRTGQTLTDFLDAALTQAAVHWILGCVFLRFIEDNGLVERPWLAGPGERMHLARDRCDAYFREHPHQSDLDYLLACFDEAAKLPGMAGLFDRRHNPLFRLLLSGDGAMELLAFFRTIDPDSGQLIHDFTDPNMGTRFLGDLYQDLSEAARKRYALLQTPEFVEEFILERTLEPAIREFGYREVRMIDPTCGSGHFLLGSFIRLLAEWQRHEPGRNARDLAQKALDGIAGVDLNPFATEIARFRLLLAALDASDIEKLAHAPDFRINLATGDSLLHGRHFRQEQQDFAQQVDDATWARVLKHVYEVEDAGDLTRILGRQYHAVVGNPPYITPKDPAMRSAYRELYTSCYMKYALVAPFIERFFDLSLDGRMGRGAGYVGLIVANSFMKREFGKKLIESVIPQLDLTHMVDTSGAYIPGHGTPTAILFGRNRAPAESMVRTVMGIKGEPATPADPAQGEVWSAILRQIDQVESESAFVSVVDSPRRTFSKHPWSIGGGGAADALEAIHDHATHRLREKIESAGFMAITGEDDLFLGYPDRFRRFGFPQKKFGVGDEVRDWQHSCEAAVLFPYNLAQGKLNSIEIEAAPTLHRALAPYRTTLRQRLMFGKTQEQSGLPWWEYRYVAEDRVVVGHLITFAEVATHNHFVLTRGGKVFKQTAPVIKLPAKASEDDHLALLGLLNSSTACFWFKQMCHNKGSTVDDRGARQRTAPFEDFYQLNGTRVGQFPLAEPYPLDKAQLLDSVAQTFTEHLPQFVAEQDVPTRQALDAAKKKAEAARTDMIALQEELDWRCYRLYGLVDQDLEYPGPPSLQFGERAFEIAMARQIEVGKLETAWFERHRSTPITVLPAHWPDDYRALVERRIELIQTDRIIGLIERPEHKRRWALEPWETMEKEALEHWLLDRLEDERYRLGEPTLVSTSSLADLARSDEDFLQVAEIYSGRTDFDVAALVKDLVLGASVPFLPVLRYKESGLRKRAQWERTWDFQRQEDAIDARAGLPEIDPARLSLDQARAFKAKEIGDIPVPPKYRSADFQKADYWRLRGGLDVPKERFVSYPLCERDADGSPVVCWAGHDHLQQAQAIATYYLERKERDGWVEEQLVPLLAGLRELLPWLHQWHDAYDPAMGVRMGQYFADFLRDETRELGLTDNDLRKWAPPAGMLGKARRRRAAA